MSTVPVPRAAQGSGRARLLTAVLLAPAGVWYGVLLVAPLVIVFVYSFGVRAKNGGYAPAFVLDNYARALSKPEPFLESLWIAAGGTIGCLLLGIPLAYFIATRARRRKSLLILLLVVPFWTSFLIRTYAWVMILGPRSGAGAVLGALTGQARLDLLGTPGAVLIGLVYGYLPLMVFPLYVTFERMDRTLVEASKDLGAGRWRTFRQITLPIALPGLVTGSILVFIPMMGEYVIPQMLGLARTYLVGNALVTDFLDSRNWPNGSARAVLLIAIMLVTVTVYLRFVARGRRTREENLL
jgi:spermidine/putrescine transport system permease protein